MLAWPSSSCTTRRSAPCANKCVANEWRSVCGRHSLIKLRVRRVLLHNPRNFRPFDRGPFGVGKQIRAFRFFHRDLIRFAAPPACPLSPQPERCPLQSLYAAASTGRHIPATLCPLEPSAPCCPCQNTAANRPPCPHRLLSSSPFPKRVGRKRTAVRTGLYRAGNADRRGQADSKAASFSEGTAREAASKCGGGLRCRP